MFCCAPKTIPQRLLEEGNSYMKIKDFPNAIDKYHECLTVLDFENPNVSISDTKVDKYVIPALTQIAQCCLELQQWQKCLNYCKQALKLRPNNKKLLQIQGIACVQTGDFKGAMKHMPKN
jgi:tetratricopeptide (TPR) repeat protein